MLHICIVTEYHSKGWSCDWMSLIQCPDCTRQRLMRRSYIVKQMERHRFSDGRCLSCNAIKRNASWSDTLRPDAKIAIKTADGYNDIHLKSLKNDVVKYPLAVAMQHWNGNIKRVLEHRLVMAVHLQRALTEDEIVHHKNGIKDDNRVENLELLSIATHHHGHGDFYYQAYHESVLRVKQLEEQLIHYKGASNV